MDNFNTQTGKGDGENKCSDCNSKWHQFQINSRHLIPDKVVYRVARLPINSDGIIWPNGTANGQGRQKMRRPAQPRNEESLFQLIAQGKELVEVCLATCLNWDSPICFQQLPFPHCWRAQERSPRIPVTIDQSITKKLFNINESENREMQISGTYIQVFSQKDDYLLVTLIPRL